MAIIVAVVAAAVEVVSVPHTVSLDLCLKWRSTLAVIVKSNCSKCLNTHKQRSSINNTSSRSNIGIRSGKEMLSQQNIS